VIHVLQLNQEQSVAVGFLSILVKGAANGDLFRAALCIIIFI
jgi:hypothetical protein